jgi:hypothetical protein
MYCKSHTKEFESYLKKCISIYENVKKSFAINSGFHLLY